MSKEPDIIYTITDEAPMLATASFLPIVKRFVGSSGISIGAKDISLAGRIIANFPENLKDEQKQPNALAELGNLVEQPEANVIKLPNISASIPQLQEAITELQEKGYSIPDYPEDPQGEDKKDIQDRYKMVLGSAVNPVLRQGNADRRPIPAVKENAKEHPPEVAKWKKDSKTHVTHMQGSDFFANEKSITIEQNSVGNARIEFVNGNGDLTILKEKISLEDGEVVDATFMSVKILREFIKEQMQEAKEQGVLFSLHLKATMMKVSDPVIFGHAVEVFFENVFKKHRILFDELGVNPNNGVGDIEAKIGDLQDSKIAEIKEDIQRAIEDGPDLYMVDVDRDITNLHAPNNVIIDASIPPIIRWGGQATGPDGKEHDVKIVVPDQTYAVFHKAMAEFAREEGFDPATLGNVFNIGLMAKKAEEYGSHDKTFMAPEAGTIRVMDTSGNVLHEHIVEKGDIWRMCQTKDEAIKNWIELAVKRARITQAPVVFWLDENRQHDAQLISKLKEHLATMDTQEIEWQILAPQDAALFTNKRAKEGLDTNAATGNVLRDHLTDMYPIIEIGTSAKMLSIVPLMNGGAVLETGAGGSAPKHVKQFIEEGHLRWDSLGEFAALAASLDHLGRYKNSTKASVLSKTLNQATTRLLSENKSPSRKVNELDNRGEQFFLALYWAHELVEQSEDKDLRDHFASLAQTLSKSEGKIVEELNTNQGKEVDLGGYYLPDTKKLSASMRPSKTLNALLDKL